MYLIIMLMLFVKSGQGQYFDKRGVTSIAKSDLIFKLRFLDLKEVLDCFV